MASATKSAWKNPSYLQSSFGIFMFFCSWGIWWSFFSRWLTDPTHGLGMTSAEQGQIYSITPWQPWSSCSPMVPSKISWASSASS